MAASIFLQRFSRITASGQYLPAIDGLRFMAIMPVLLQHLSERVQRFSPVAWATPIAEDNTAFIASRGTIGVFLFFAISGFILALPFARHALQGSQPMPYRHYLWRRVTRLEPPYLFWMSFFFVVLLIKGEAFGELFPHWVASSLYLHNILYTDYTPINPVAWSLEIEIQFYLLAPLLAKLFFSIRPPQLRLFVIAASIPLFITLQHALGWAHSPYKLTLLGQLQHFLVGFLLVDLYLSHWQQRPQQPARWLDAAAVLAFAIMALTWSEEYGKSLLFSASLALVFIAGFRGHWFVRFLQLPWVAVTGGMCYTIYLVHLPLMEALVRFSSQLHIGRSFTANLLLQAAIVLPIVLAFSALAFLVLEKPFMDKAWPQRAKIWLSENLFHVKKATQS